LEDEVLWLWPLSRKGYRLLERRDLDISRDSFMAYWRTFLFWYLINRRLTAILEVVFIVVVVVVVL
ncbi:MAG: hypothetical protein AAB855_03705, partial [Patescibacteria group bacterium]